MKFGGILLERAAKVSDLEHCSVLRQQDVVELQIRVHDVQLAEELQRGEELPRVPERKSS
jgi:hypothetical protein